MTAVFADTFYYIAFLSERDAAHEAAVRHSRMYRGKVITTEFVLVEVADGLANTPQRDKFADLLSFVVQDPETTIVPATSGLFQRAVAHYTNRPDKLWSLTDCTSFLVMEDHVITDALTGDHHFEQAGFRILL